MKLYTASVLLKAGMKLWRFDHMYKKSKNVAKTVGVGLAVGAAAAAVSAGIAHRATNGKSMSSVKKTAGKAMHNVSEFIDDLSKVMG